jgi:hypothetical protein
MRKMVGTLTLGWLLASAWPAALMAQGQSRKEKREEALKRPLEGLVTDADGNVLSGAVVKLKDMKTLEVRSFITKDDGKYHYYGLNVNNDYEVQASYGKLSCKPRMLSIYDSRRKPNLDLKLETHAEPNK